MGYVKENKDQGIEEDYIPDWYKDIETKEFQPKPVPGINTPQINEDISIEN